MRAVKPTRAQKIFIEKRKLDSKNWLVLEDTDECLTRSLCKNNKIDI